MRVLITGGAGYIGSHLADRFLAEGAAVTVIDDLSAGQRSNVAHNLKSSRFRFVQGDVLDRPLMEGLVSGHDLVCHLAAVVGVRRVLADPLQAMLQNVGGTEMVLALAYEYGRRVLFASTSEIYGKSGRMPFAEDDDRVLGSTRIARWAYSTAKALEHCSWRTIGQLTKWSRPKSPHPARWQRPPNLPDACASSASDPARPLSSGLNQRTIIKTNAKPCCSAMCTWSLSAIP